MENATNVARFHCLFNKETCRMDRSELFSLAILYFIATLVMSGCGKQGHTPGVPSLDLPEDTSARVAPSLVKNPNDALAQLTGKLQGETGLGDQEKKAIEEAIAAAKKYGDAMAAFEREQSTQAAMQALTVALAALTGACELLRATRLAELGVALCVYGNLQPLFALYNQTTRKHFYSTLPAEIDAKKAKGFVVQPKVGPVVAMIGKRPTAGCQQPIRRCKHPRGNNWVAARASCEGSNGVDDGPVLGFVCSSPQPYRAVELTRFRADYPAVRSSDHQLTSNHSSPGVRFQFETRLGFW